MSASPGCSDGRFNAPSERCKAGETARTLHHQMYICLPDYHFTTPPSCRRPPSVSDSRLNSKHTPRPVRITPDVNTQSISNTNLTGSSKCRMLQWIENDPDFVWLRRAGAEPP